MSAREDYDDILQEQRRALRAATTDPVAFFQNAADLPTLLYQENLFIGTFFYASRVHRSGSRAGPISSIAQAYSRKWPLPVGRKSLQSCFNGSDLDVAMIADSMPFDGDELAGWILDTTVMNSRVEAFGLVGIEPLEQDEVDIITAGLEFRITGTHVTSPAIRELCDNIGRWWKSLGGQSIVKRGRPLGTKLYSVEQFREKYENIQADAKRARVKLNGGQMADRMGLSRSAYYDYLKVYKKGH